MENAFLFFAAVFWLNSFEIGFGTRVFGVVSSRFGFVVVLSKHLILHSICCMEKSFWKAFF